MTETTPNDGPMEDVREGMLVVDRTGEEVGAVVDMKMGDPSAVTSAGQEQPEQDQLMATIATALGFGLELPEALAERMRMLGYLRLSQRRSRHETFVVGDQVAEVSAGRVRLNVDRDELLAA